MSSLEKRAVRASRHPINMRSYATLKQVKDHYQGKGWSSETAVKSRAAV